MKYIYGLNISGQSILKYFYSNKIPFLAWDDNEQIRNLIELKFKDVHLIHPQALDCSKISEVFVSPGISLKDDVLKIFKRFFAPSCYVRSRTDCKTIDVRFKDKTIRILAKFEIIGSSERE